MRPRSPGTLVFVAGLAAGALAPAADAGAMQVSACIAHGDGRLYVVAGGGERCKKHDVPVTLGEKTSMRAAPPALRGEGGTR